MKVLVTGGTGFIGSHLTDLLIEAGHQVVVIDNLSQSNLKYLNRQAVFYQIDLLDPALGEIIAREQPQIVFHQAAQVNVHRSVKAPVSDAQVNILGTLNLLQSAVNHHVKKVIYASTCAVYGETESDPIKETEPIKPASGYGLSKLTGERYVQLFQQLYGLNYTILRYANVFGPRQGTVGEGGVISIFTQQLKQGKAATIYGDGKQTRDFIYVKDVALANMNAMTRGDNQVINIGSGQATTIESVYHQIEKILKKKIPANYHSDRPGDIRHSRLCNKRAQTELDWSPRYSLYEGLQEML